MDMDVDYEEGRDEGEEGERKFITNFLAQHSLAITHHLAHLVLLCHFLVKRRCCSPLFALVYSAIVIYVSFLEEKHGSMIWGCIYFFVNFILLISAFCGGRRFNGDLEQVYKKLFAPLKVTRKQFRKLLSCKRNLRVLHPGEIYAIEKSTRVDSLALLLSGRLVVSQNNRALHVIHPNQFVDSPEYFGVSTDELFQVTITSVEESKILVWHRDKLRLTIMEDQFLGIMFDHILGRDVVRKLIQVSDGNFGKEKKNEFDPMIPAEDPPNIKYFANDLVWSLGKIDEETPV